MSKDVEVKFTEKVITQTIKVPTYKVTTSQEELDFLYVILRRISGDPQKSPRGLGETVYNKIREHVDHNNADKIAKCIGNELGENTRMSFRPYV